MMRVHLVAVACACATLVGSGAAGAASAPVASPYVVADATPASPYVVADATSASPYVVADATPAPPYVVADATPAPPYVVASLPEPPNNIAVSDTGIIVASLFDARAVAMIALDGTTRIVDINCSPRDVAIDPSGETAWAVCTDSEHISAIDAVTGAVTQAGIGATGLDDITYLPAADRLLVASIEGFGGQIITVSGVEDGQYEVTDRVVSDSYGFTQLAPFPDGSRTYARTDGGALLYVDIEMAGQIIELRRPTTGRTVASVALSPTGTALYVVAQDFTDESDVRMTIERVNPSTGAAMQSVPLDFTIPSGTKIDIAANHRSVFVSSGISIRVGDATSGLIRLPTDGRGRLSAPESLDQTSTIGTGVDTSSRGGRVAFGAIQTQSTDYRAVGMQTEGRPYPRAIAVTASAKGAQIKVTGTTVSLRPVTKLTVHVKDLTKAKARFVTQATPAFVSITGTLAWKGKAPSKRFALYVSGGGTQSNTVTVAARR